MNVENAREYCLNKKTVTEDFPFDETTLVFKVTDKIFALLSLDYPHSINLKCDPQKAIELRERYDEIKPGYHMNKQHWNTVDLTGTLNDKLIKELIDHSYTLVVNKLTKKVKEKVNSLYK